jgi:DNA polymerase-1
MGSGFPPFLQEQVLMSEARELYLIDGSALAYKSYFAFARNPLTNSKGENTSAVFGFTRSLLKILDEQKPTYLAVVFDRPEPTFRHRDFAEYKIQRAPMPPEMAAQLPRIKEVVEALRVAIVEVPGFEADDVIATLARRAAEQGFSVTIVSGDKDLAQLVNERIRLYNPRKGGEESEILDASAVREKLGVPPEKIPDLLALAGDSVDNIPGVKGIGPKTAEKLLQQFGSLEAIYENLEAVQPERIRALLREQEAEARLSKRLATVATDVPIELKLEDVRVGDPDRARLVELFRELEFHSLLERFVPSSAASEDHDYRILRTRAELERLVEELRQAGTFALDLETTSLDPLRARIVGFSFAWRWGAACYLPLRGPSGSRIELTEEEVLAKLRPVLEDPSLRKVGQNMKYDLLVLRRSGIELRGMYFDTMVAAYLLNPSERQHNLDSLSLEYLNYKKIPTSSLIGKRGKEQLSMDQVAVEMVGEYACEDADITWRLYRTLEPKLREAGLEKLFHEVEMPLVEVLADMEYTGVKLDLEYLREMSRQLESDLRALEERIYAVAGERFNINSPQQLGRVLFERLKLPARRRTKTGYSTDVRVLEELAGQHELPRLLLEYRQLAKLKSTYVDALPQMVNPRTGRVHTSYNQTITATGRLSSSEPNLQNIPIRTEIGRQIRRAFIPSSEDHVLLDADYSQIELRIMAHLSGDRRLRESFERDEDVHTRTAALIFGLEPEEVTPEHRRRAKEVNFGILYGMGPYGLAQRLGISPEEAQRFITGYFATYPKVHDFILETIQRARRHRFVTTLLNRRRYLPDILSENVRVREFAERTAINTPIQGTAADLIKVAMVRIWRELRKRGLKTKMILQVHDELVFDVPKEELEEVKELVRTEMESAIHLDVPVKVEIGVGRNWLEAAH